MAAAAPKAVAAKAKLAPPEPGDVHSRRFTFSWYAAVAAGVAHEPYVACGAKPLDRALAWRRDCAPTWIVLGHEHRMKRGGTKAAAKMEAIVTAAAAEPPPPNRDAFTRMLERRGRVAQHDGGANAYSWTYEVVPKARAVARAHYAVNAGAVCFMHEITDGACRFYGDVDIWRTQNPEIDCEALFTLLVHTLDRLLAHCCETTSSTARGAAIVPPRWRFTDSSTAEKFSRHLVCVNSRAESSEPWAGVATQAVWELGAEAFVRDGEKMRSALDLGVYTAHHPMRAVNSAKIRDETRVLRLWPAPVSVPVDARTVEECLVLCPPACPPGTPIGAEAGLYYGGTHASEQQRRIMRNLGVSAARSGGGNEGGFINVPLDSEDACAAGPDTLPHHAGVVREILAALKLPNTPSRLDFHPALRLAYVRSKTRLCTIKRGHHSSSNVFYRLQLDTCRYVARCHSPKCDQRDAVWYDFPPLARDMAQALIGSLSSPAAAGPPLAPAQPVLGAAVASLLLSGRL